MAVSQLRGAALEGGMARQNRLEHVVHRVFGQGRVVQPAGLQTLREGEIRSKQYVAIEFIATGARFTWLGSTFDDERRRFRCLPMVSNAATSITGPTPVASAAGLLERLP